MSEWKEVRLRDVILTANTGADAIKKAPIVNYDTGFKCLRIGDLSNNREYGKWGFTNIDLNIYEKYKILKDDIFIARTGNTIGVVKYIKKDLKSVYNNGLIRLRVNKEKTIAKYIYYLCISENFQNFIQSLAYGTSTQPNMKINDMLSYNFNLPPLPIQKKIADILSVIDEKIETLQNINETLEEMAKAIFKSWFVDFDIIKAKEEGKSDSEIAKEFGISEKIVKLFPSEFIESEIGKIPKGWEVVYLKDEFKFERGVEPGSKFYFENPKEEEIKNKNLIPFYRVKDLETKANVYIQKEVSKNKISKFGEVLVSFDGTIGRVSVFLNGSYSSGIRKITAKNYSNAFIYFLMQSDYIQDLIKQYATGTTILHAGKSINYLYLVKNEDVIREYEKFVMPIFDEILNNTQQIQTLQNLRDILLPKLINGEIEVDELEIKGMS